MSEAQQPVRPKRRVVVIANPEAGMRRPRLLSAVVERLLALGCTVSVHDTGAPGHARQLAREAVQDGADTIVVAGGDGTVNEVINGLAEMGGGAMPNGIALAVVPAGTANVLAAEMGLPTRPEALARIIAEGRPCPICLGEANGRRFAMMVGVGFDAHVVAGVDLKLKRHTGKLAYVVETVSWLARYRPCHYHVAVDGTTYTAASAIIANGHYYGGRFVCAPQARLTDPQLYVCLFLKPGRWRMLRYLLALVTGRLASLPDVRIIPANTVTVTGPVGEPVQGDGDIIGALPVSISVAGERLSLLMPS